MSNMTPVPYLPTAGLTLGGEMGSEQAQGTWNPALQIQMSPARPGRLLAGWTWPSTRAGVTLVIHSQTHKSPSTSGTA